MQSMRHNQQDCNNKEVAYGHADHLPGPRLFWIKTYSHVGKFYFLYSTLSCSFVKFPPTFLFPRRSPLRRASLWCRYYKNRARRHSRLYYQFLLPSPYFLCCAKLPCAQLLPRDTLASICPSAPSFSNSADILCHRIRITSEVV